MYSSGLQPLCELLARILAIPRNAVSNLRPNGIKAFVVADQVSGWIVTSNQMKQAPNGRQSLQHGQITRRSWHRNDHEFPNTGLFDDSPGCFGLVERSPLLTRTSQHPALVNQSRPASSHRLALADLTARCSVSLPLTHSVSFGLSLSIGDRTLRSTSGTHPDDGESVAVLDSM